MATLNPKVLAWKNKWTKEFLDMDTKYKTWEKEDWEKNQNTYKEQGYNRIEDPNSVWGSKWSYKKPTEQNPPPIKKDKDENPVSKVPEEVVKPIPETIARPLDEDSTNPYVSPWALYAKSSVTPTKPKKTQAEQGFWERAFRGLGLYSDPAVATASGWRHDQFGDIVQDLQNDELVTKLRNNLATIAGTALGVTNVAAKVANWGTSLPLLTSNVATNQAALPGPMNILRDKFGNIISSWKQGGTMNKVKYFAQGGLPQTLNDIQRQVEALVEAAMAGDQKATQQVNQIMEAAKAGDLKATLLAQMIQVAAQKLQGQATMNKWGSKLQYMKSLKYGKGGKTKSCPVCEQQVEMKKCGGKKAKKHFFGGGFYVNDSNPMRMSNGRNVVGIVNKERFKNSSNSGVSQTVYDQSGSPVVQKDKTSNGGEREIYYNVRKPIKRKGLFSPRHEMVNDTVYISGTPEMFLNAPNMSTSEKRNQANRFAYGIQ